MKIKELTDKLSNMVMDKDPEPVKPVASHPTQNPAPTPLSMPMPTPSGSYWPPSGAATQFQPSPVSNDNGDALYKDLADKTDFFKTQPGAEIQKFLTSLTGTNLDEPTKLRLAITQTKNISGLTDASLTSAFDQIRQKMESEKTSFGAQEATFNTNEVAARQKRIEEINRQITQLNTDMAESSTKLFQAQAKIRSARASFDIAWNRRAGELAAQEAQIQNSSK